MNKIEEQRLRLLSQGKKIINLSWGNPAACGIHFPSSILRRGLARYLKNPLYKPDPKGDLAARRAVQSFYEERGFAINADQILLTSGTSESYFEIFKLLTRPGDEILFPRPAYPLFEEIAHLAEVKIRFYTLDEKHGWQIDFKNLEAQISPRTRAIVLVSPNNPTGSVLSAQTLQGVLAVAIRHGLPIISDEVFSELIFDGKTFPRVAAIAQQNPAHLKGLPTIFTLNGISKTYALPGLKLSWIVVTSPAHANFIDQLERITDAFLACNQISQTLLPTIIKSGKAFLKKYRTQLQKNRDLAVKILSQNPRISFHIPEGGPYLFAKIAPPAPARHRARLGSGEDASKSVYQIEKSRARARDSARAEKLHGQMSASFINHSEGFTDEQLVLDLMQKTGIYVHPGYFYDYEESVYILISFLGEKTHLKKSLELLAHFLSS